MKRLILLAILLLCSSPAFAFSYVTVADTIFSAETAQDGYINGNGSNFYSTSTANLLGRTTSTNIFSSFATFDDLSIPDNAILDTVFVRMVANATSAGTPAVRIYFEGIASGTAPTTYADYTDEVLTTAYVDWGPTGWSAGTRYSTPNLKTPMQEQCDRGDYAAGNDFNVLIKDNGSGTSNNCSYREGSYATPGSEVILYVVYHIPDAINGRRNKILKQTLGEYNFFKYQPSPTWLWAGDNS